MNKKIAIGIGIIIAIVVVAYVVTSEFSYEKTTEISGKNNSTSATNKNKTYEITASESIGIRSP